MIKNLQITGVHTKLSKELEDFTRKKIGGLDKYIPKKARESAHAEVIIKEMKVRDKNRFECEVIMGLRSAQLTVKEKGTTPNAAVDVAENNLKVQLKKYKDKHAGPRLHRRLINRIKRSP